MPCHDCCGALTGVCQHTSVFSIIRIMQAANLAVAKILLMSTHTGVEYHAQHASS